MTRIISGLVGGRRIEVPKSGVRPTTDRVRESLFSALDSRIQNWNQIQVLDLFAGSGALGIEALSAAQQRPLLLSKTSKQHK